MSLIAAKTSTCPRVPLSAGASARRRAAQPASDHSILPRPGKPSAAAVAPVRSHSLPAI